PQYEGKLSLNALSSPVEVQYDVNGIPHIQAQNESDGFMALGYVMAQDRLFQMDLIRRVAKGELAEIFGPKALEADYLFRTLSLTRGIEKQIKLGLMDAQTVKLMESFYRGVNAFIEKGDLSFEFSLLKYRPKPFDMMDGFGVLGYMAYSFAQGFKTDPLMNALLQSKGEGYANKLRSQPLPILKQKTSRILAPDFHFEESVWFKGNNFVEQNIGLFEGSNAWVLGPNRTQDGLPLLAGDPHVSFSLPGLWYEAHIKWPTQKKEDFEWYGHFVPGLPFAAMGHGPKHGWAVTISYIDDMDFIKIDDSHPTKEREEIIKVKGEKDKTFKVVTSSYGPLIQGLLKPHLRKSKERVAMKWGHHNPKNLSAKAFYGAMMANSKDEFEQSLALGKSPGLNVIYADVEGNIARYLFGEYWRRPRNMSGDIFYPSYRTDLADLPSVDFFDRPHLVNPESGVIVSANQKPEGVPELKAGYFQPMDRYTTIHEILKGKEKWNIQEMKYVQTSPVNILFKEYQARIVESVKLQVKKGSRNIKALEIFENWDGMSSSSSAGAFIFYKFMNKFQKQLFSDLNEKEYQGYCNSNNGWHVLTRTLLDKSEQGKVFKAFSAAIKELHEKHGGPANWAIGKEQTLTFSHPLSRAGAALAFFLDIGPEPMNGGYNQINNMRPVGCKDGLKVKAGPSSRRLISFSNPEESLGILPLGNSGHYESPFFSNQWDKFKKGEYRAQWMRRLKEEEVKFSLSLLPSK
ncbi:MAG: penicillin acylase family protein, partial [Halobacteriovoraceae bacterium]|nr:penicillin acylase family protein [Halobacteriovoraceae bacterium]